MMLNEINLCMYNKYNKYIYFILLMNMKLNFISILYKQINYLFIFKIYGGNGPSHKW